MKFKSSILAIFAVFATPSFCAAGETILPMKAGDVKITILDADGIRPLAGVDVKLQNAQEAVRLIQATTDRNGSCTMTLEQGTYGLEISGKMVALINSAEDAETTHLRLVTPRKPLYVGGAEGTNATGSTNAVNSVAGSTNASPAQVVAEEEGKRRGLFGWLGNKGLNTALIIGGAVATGIIIENENDDSSASTTTPEVPAAKPKARRSGSKTPDIDKPVSD